MATQHPAPVQQDQHPERDTEDRPLPLIERTVERAPEDQTECQRCAKHQRTNRKKWIVREGIPKIEAQQ